LILGAAGLVLGVSATLVLSALRDDIVFFRSPSEIASGAVAAGTQIRLGGMVEEGSITRSADGLQVAFRVTDGSQSLPVSYHGILPDLFREGQGVVAEGKMRDGTFEAATVLAKHDENYMPREVQAALEKGGYQIPAQGGKASGGEIVKAFDGSRP
jgi:cytochrome c-type biogenesis protein CcmE